MAKFPTAAFGNLLAFGAGKAGTYLGPFFLGGWVFWVPPCHMMVARKPGSISFGGGCTQKIVNNARNNAWALGFAGECAATHFRVGKLYLQGLILLFLHGQNRQG